MPDSKAAHWIAGVITTVWAVSFVLDAINPSYDPPATVGALMMAVAGAIFGGSAIQSLKKNGKNGDKK